jgi:adenosylcobyric acid synthase
MPLAKTLMVQGTASSVGKSTLVAGLGRLFAQDGWRVAPFKAQNMALNATVTPDGGEIGRAQAMQAEAAGVTPTVEMNPILLKPEGDARSQVIVMGRPLATMEAQEYYRHRTGFLNIVQQALHKLREEYDLLILEGAGSPVEINLAHYDLVNMRVAQLAEAPVVLVGDIDRGGIFASLLGTLLLLRPEERARVKGLIVNKFRGDLSLWREGEQLLASQSGVPVLGTIPLLNNLHLAEEDSVALDDRTAAVFQGQQKQANALLEVVLLRLPYLSNYDEFDALAADQLVRLHVVATPQEFPCRPDLIILPGTKNTFFDLTWLWRQGLAQHIRQVVKQGCAVLGICGGYQMLGERLSDPTGAEAAAGTVEPGLGLLPVETVFGPLSEKVTRQSVVQVNPVARRGLFANLHEKRFQVYQIHLVQVQATCCARWASSGHSKYSQTRLSTS